MFVFYVLLNEPVKNHWLVKFGLKEAPASRRSTVTSPSTPKTDNVYANTGGASTSAAGQEHTYASANAEFPAKSDNSTKL